MEWIPYCMCYIPCFSASPRSAEPSASPLPPRLCWDEHLCCCGERPTVCGTSLSLLFPIRKEAVGSNACYRFPLICQVLLIYSFMPTDLVQSWDLRLKNFTFSFGLSSKSLLLLDLSSLGICHLLQLGSIFFNLLNFWIELSILFILEQQKQSSLISLNGSSIKNILPAQQHIKLPVSDVGQHFSILSTFTHCSTFL